MKEKKKTRPILLSTGEDSYFAASNSQSGFCSYYGECFDRPEIGRVYAVKGGPGTGKSRFMREVADAGLAAGYRAEHIYCSSDPDSLDGVLLFKDGEGIALLDATAPHVYEPRRVGYREQIVNLGEFWDPLQLQARAEEIEELNRRRSDAYRRAYRFLAGYGEVESNRRELTAPYIRLSAIQRTAERLLHRLPEGERFSAETALLSSVGMRGRALLDSYLARAKKLYLIEDCRGSGAYLTEALYRVAAEKRLRVRVSKDPVLPHRVDGLFLCESGIAFVLLPELDCSYPHKRLSMRHFVETGRMKEVRGAINFCEHLQEALLEGAIEELGQVRELHFQLEEIYTASMCFQAKEQFTREFCRRLFEVT